MLIWNIKTVLITECMMKMKQLHLNTVHGDITISKTHSSDVIQERTSTLELWPLLIHLTKVVVPTNPTEMI